MVKLSAKFRNLRIQFKIKSFSSSNREIDREEEVEMQTSPTQKDDLLSGSAVPDSSRHSDKCVESRACSEDNKENNGSVTDQSCKSSAKMASKKDTRKNRMKCSEVLNTDNRHKKLGAIDNLSHTSVSSTASARGRKGNDSMKYSSIAHNNFARVPSAKTISDCIFTPSSASSSEYKSLSPATQQIIKEVDSAYMSSPIPTSYLRSKEGKRTPSSSKQVLEAYASSPIQSSKNKRSSTNPKQLHEKEKESLERKASYQSSSDGRSRSPVTVASGVSALAVKREKQQRQARIQDAQSKGGVNGRQNLDKRTARLRYGDAFQADIAGFRATNTHLNNGSNHIEKVSNQIQDRHCNGICVFVRKRPLFDYEFDRGDYDVVSIDNTTHAAFDECIVHNCHMHPDMKQMLMKITRFPVTAAFDERCSDDSIYKHVARPLVSNAAEGGISTILMYGQTGCGKSHTISGIEQRTAADLFQILDGSSTVTIQFVELCGSKECKDLLSPSLSAVKIRDNADGSVELSNATALDVSTPEDLADAIRLAKSRRATEATDKNGVSSRSHAVCQLQIQERKGILTLIDCAGSERRHDSMYHDSQRQKESAEINASLWAIKECIRARASQSSRIPYRSSNLTRILRESFERDDAKLSIIGCVAGNASDTDHTTETLKTISAIVGSENRIIDDKARPVMKATVQTKVTANLPKQWSQEELKSFLSKNNIDNIQLAPTHNGAALMKLSVSQIKAQLKADADDAEKLFNLLRTENDRISKAQRQERMRLAKERKGNMTM